MVSENIDKIREKAVVAMLTLAAQKGWTGISMPAIALEAGLSLADLSQAVHSRHDLLVEYSRMVDQECLANAGNAESLSNSRDRLFDLLMERFDILNRHRSGVMALLKDLPLRPGQAACALPHLGNSMRWMLEGAGVDTSGLQGTLRIIGISVTYLVSLKEWMKDEAEDMGSTMAALDKNLGRAEEWARTFRLA